MLKETIISHLVKPEDLQHHGTLFAGRMAEWLVETCFIAASRFVGRPKDIVCVKNQLTTVTSLKSRPESPASVLRVLLFKVRHSRVIVRFLPLRAWLLLLPSISMGVRTHTA